MHEAALAGLGHTQRVRFLYKFILNLHRSLPPDIRAVGDKYVKEEFRKHKNVSQEFIRPFMLEWTRYAVELSTQLKETTHGCNELQQKLSFGKPLDESSLNYFSEVQLNQLLSLAKELYSSNCDQSGTNS